MSVERILPFTEYGCLYVKTSRWSISRPEAGCLAFWKDKENLVVTPHNTGCLAGFYLDALPRGEHGWIKLEG